MTSTPSAADHRSAATADLAHRLGVDPHEITVVTDEEVTWRDSSLGCPEPGRMYAQSLVDGHRIVLSAAGHDYVYHSGGTTPPFLCEAPQSPAPADTDRGPGSRGGNTG